MRVINPNNSVSNEEQAALAHLKYDSAKDRIIADRPIETTLDSLYLGEQHIISSGSDNVFYTNANTLTAWSACWSGLKNQSVPAKQGHYGIYVPQGRTYSENRVGVEPWGVPSATPGSSTLFATSFVFDKSYSVTGVEVVLEEEILATDYLFFSLHYDDAAGIETYEQIITGQTGAVNSVFDWDFRHPVEEYHTLTYYMHVEKASTRNGPRQMLQVRQSMSTPAEPGLKFFARTFLDRNISVGITQVSAAAYTMTFPTQLSIDTTANVVAITVPTTNTQIQLFRVFDEQGTFFTNACSVTVGNPAVTMYLDVSGDDITFFAQNVDTDYGDGTGTGDIWYYFNNRTGDAGLVSAINSSSFNEIPSYRRYSIGGTYTDGEWSYDPATEKIYECNTTGVQTGTFASNSAKWDSISASTLTAPLALNTTHRIEMNSACTDDSGKVLHIALNDLGAGTQFDKSAQGNDATPSGGVVVTATGGRYTSGASFDGVADAYSIPVTAGFPTGNAVRTIEALVRPTSTGLGAFTIFSYGPDVFRQIFQIRREGSRLEIFNREDVAFSGDGVFIAGKWQEVQVTYDGTVANAWVDKVHVITDFPITLETVATDAYIGRADTDTSNEDFWIGDIDYVRMYDRVLADNALYTSALRAPKIVQSLTDIALNNTHRLSDGKGHADVVLNNAHRISDGSDHSFIDQDLTASSYPQFRDLIVSTDVISKGVTWANRTSPLDQWTGVVRGNGVFVVVGKSGTANDAMTSPDGINWTIRTTPTGKNWMGLTYANGLFVAVAEGGTAGNRVMTSPDGITWTLRTTPADSNWTSIVYGKGLFVATATVGANRVMTSVDGITWTLRSSPLKGWGSVTFGNGTFVAVALLGTQQVMTSTDGINWTQRIEPVGGSWRGVTFGNGLFVAVGDGASRVMTSTDGANWTLGSVPAANGWNKVTYGNGVFVAIAWSGVGDRVMTSPDGINWTLRTSTEDNSWDAITYGDGVFVAVSLDGVTNRVMTAGAIIDGVVISETLDQSVKTTSSPTFAAIKVTAGAPGVENVLTSDADGLASWQPIDFPVFTLPQDIAATATPTFAGVITDNVAIKVKKLTGTTAATEGAGVVIAHGLDRTKILSVDILVDDGALSIGPGGAVSPGRVFTRQVSPFDVEVWTHATDSENILSKPFSVTIMYEA